MTVAALRMRRQVTAGHGGSVASVIGAGGVAAPLRLVRDPLRILLFVLTVLTVSRIHQHYPILAKLRPALLLVIATTGYAYLNPRFLTRANVTRYWPVRFVAILCVLACSSAVFGISLGRSATFILDVYIKTIIYALLLVVSIRHVRDLFTLVWAYVLSCGILAFMSLFVFGITKTGSNDFARLSNLYTYDANDLGVVMMIGLPLTLLLLGVTRGWGRWLLMLNLVGIAATIARSGSRGGFLGFVAVGVGALILADGISIGKRAVLLFVAPLALGLGAPAGYWKQMSTVLDPKEDYNYSALDGRKAVAERGIGYMLKYPAFGLGMDNFSRAECTISPKLQTLNRTGPIRCTPPHNSYVEAGAELGVPGLVVWVSLVFGMIVAPLRFRRRLPRAWKRGTQAERFLYGAAGFFSLAMIGFAVTAFFVTFAWMEPLYIVVALVTGWYMAVGEQLRSSANAVAGFPVSAEGIRRGKHGWRLAMSGERFRASQSLKTQ
jgi:O-antigen ligase